MNRIDKIKVGEIEIICIDYCNLTQDQMIALESEAAELILTGNKALYVVTDSMKKIMLLQKSFGTLNTLLEN